VYRRLGGTKEVLQEQGLFFLPWKRKGKALIGTKYHIKILLRDRNPKVGREDIFKPTAGNESLHEDGNDNGVRAVKFVTSKI
jgi:hypothetical protein